MKKLVVVIPMVLLLASCGHNATVEVEETVPVEVEINEEVVAVVEPELIEYRVTAYCPCEECCGEWAKNRPLDENGEPIVYGAWWGKELTDKYSAASPMAFGTKVNLEGYGVVEVQDRTAKWVVDRFGENIIDIYMTDHDEAAAFEVQYLKGEIIE